MTDPKLVTWKQGQERGVQILCCGYYTFIREHCSQCGKKFPEDLLRKRRFLNVACRHLL